MEDIRVSERSRSYRVLAVPLMVLLPFGHFGFRPGQVGNSITFVLVNFLCVFHYILAVAMAISIPINLTDFTQTRTKYTLALCLLLAALYTLKLHKFDQKYNLVSLLQDVREISQHRLTMKNMLVFVIMAGLVLGVLIYEFKHFIESLISVMKTGKRRPFSFATNDPTVVKVLSVFELAVWFVSSSVFMLGFSLMIAAITLVLKNEFNACASCLEQDIEKEKNLSSQGFSKATERFYKLTSIVEKVDVF